MLQANGTGRGAEDAVDEAIRQARAAGDMDALPGRGRPLRFAPDEGLARQDETWLANRILRNAAYVPPWITAGQAVEVAIRRSARAQEAWSSAGGGGSPSLIQALGAAWERENAAIRRYNRLVPHPGLQRYPVPVERRWQRLRDAARGSVPTDGR